MGGKGSLVIFYYTYHHIKNTQIIDVFNGISDLDTLNPEELQTTLINA